MVTAGAVPPIPVDLGALESLVQEAMKVNLQLRAACGRPRSAS